MLCLLPILFAPQESLERLLKPAGVELRLQVAPTDSVLSQDRRRVFVKDSRGVTVLDVARWMEQTDSSAPEDPAPRGIDCAPDGTIVFTSTNPRIHFGRLAPDGHLDWVRAMPLESGATGAGGARYFAKGSLVGLCVNGVDELHIIKPGGSLRARIPLDAPPIGVAFTPDSRYAAVICKPEGKTGALALVDLRRNAQVALIPTSADPSDVLIDSRGRMAYVGHWGSDDISVVDLQARRVVHTLTCKPAPSLRTPARPHALALAPDGKTLYAACGGANAVAVVSLRGTPQVEGYIPTGWGAVTVEATGSNVLVLCRNIAYKVATPSASELRAYTGVVRKTLQNPDVLRELKNPS